MIKSVSALLFGASLLASAPASAADYIVFSFGGTATETYTDAMLNPISVQTGEFSADLYVLATATMPYSYVSTVTSGSITSPTGSGSTFMERTNIFRFTQSINASINRGSATTLPLSGGDITGDFTLFSQYSPGSGATQSRSVRATLTSLTITRFSGTAVEGFQNISAVPEPATWMAMVLGFGLIGAMSRRHYAVSARNAASPSR